MLSEFSLTHDVFRASSYSSPEVCDLHLKILKRVLLDRGLVRDLRQGGWQNYFKEHIGEWDPRAKELVKKLVAQNRLKKAPAANPITPKGDAEWYKEAIASSVGNPLDGIITTKDTAGTMPQSPNVSTIEKLDCCDWWNDERQSVSVRRRTEDYLPVLTPVLAKANLLMFIDPHLDPSRPGYSEFIEILMAARRFDDCPPLIEIHRVCYHGHGAGRMVLSELDLRSTFQGLDEPLRTAGMTATIYVWDDFHDRFLITDLIGIQLGNGFDISNAQDEMTSWARISREHRTKIQQEFDPNNSPRHTLHATFKLGVR